LNALRANLEGDDDDDLDLDKKNKKNSNSARAGGNISTMQAIDMIRSLLSEKTGKSESKAIAANSSSGNNEQTRSPLGFEADGEEEEVEGFSAADAKQYESISTKNAFKSLPKVSASTEMDVDASADEKTASDLHRDPSKKELDSEGDAAPVASSSSSALVVVPGSTSQDVKLVRKASAKLSLDIDDETTSTVATTTSNGVPLSSLDPNRYNNMSAVYDPPAVISGTSMVCKLKDHRYFLLLHFFLFKNV
jgi:hypothetical protein